MMSSWLGANRLAAARALSARVPFSRLSKEKTGAMLGKKMDVSRSLDTSEDENNEDFGTSRITRLRKQQMLRRQRHSSSANRARLWREPLNNVSRTYRELEELIVALDALETWANIASQLNRYVNMAPRLFSYYRIGSPLITS